MYAMLTGELPFHVEPINLTALHAQILMGAKIPDHLSSCKFRHRINFQTLHR